MENLNLLQGIECLLLLHSNPNNAIASIGFGQREYCAGYFYLTFYPYNR